MWIAASFPPLCDLVTSLRQRRAIIYDRQQAKPALVSVFDLLLEEENVEQEGRPRWLPVARAGKYRSSRGGWLPPLIATPITTRPWP